MKFVLELWPDDEGKTPRDLLADAIASAADNPYLVWDILKDDGTPIAENIRIAPDEKKTEVDKDFWSETTPEMREGYRIAREMYGDDYADYLIAADEEHWKYALDCGLEFEPDPWPISLIGNDGV